MEILKVLYRGAKIIILDEPTAVLVPQEVNELFVSLRELTASGATIIFISHKLDEVLAIADDIGAVLVIIGAACAPMAMRDRLRPPSTTL